METETNVAAAVVSLATGMTVLTTLANRLPHGSGTRRVLARATRELLDEAEELDWLYPELADALRVPEGRRGGE